MTENDLDRHHGWPQDQFHPAYESFKDWLDSEAPAQIAKAKKRNTPRFRLITRRTP